MNDTQATFREARLRHNITLHMLMEDTNIDLRAVILMDQYNQGTPAHVDQLLASLSRLSGTEYSRRTKNIRGVTFKLHPDYESIPSDEAVARLAADHQQIQQKNNKL
ncbi:hypothetical protein [Dictyobacter kobayashii]|uniref:Uncharacterized protein n=1 Tax=Dictyobacter kobayashii TaxID=2014872 RepID=A0A402AUE2_9CHLR|nr:hypothetical protein [Dictyobacter kobayashii]GCE22731.1 hypothetical protein KDK_65310 [Dictyobacter kobayashii]